MAAALLWARANLRSQWRSAVLVVLIAGLCGGVAMAAFAGARRTATSYSRFLRATKDFTIFVATPDRESADLATDVLLGTVDEGLVGEAVFLAAKPTTLDKSDEFNLGVVGATTKSLGRTMVISKVVEGRVPTGARDVALNDAASHRFGLHAGDRFEMVGYSPAAFEACSTGNSSCVADVALGEVTVSGVLREPDDISPEASGSLAIQLSDALTHSWIPQVASTQWITGASVESATVRSDLGAALTEAIGADRVTGDAADVFIDENSVGDPERVQVALDVEQTGLRILGVLATLAGLVAVPQALARHRAVATREDLRLRALGWTSRNQHRAGAMWSVLLGLVAGLVAAIVAILISPLFPIGLARLAEPSPGIDVDWFVVPIGAALTLLVMVGAGALVRSRHDRVESQTPGRLARIFSASRPVPATAGRFLLDSGRMSAVARTTLTAAVLGIGMIACAATVIRSEDYMITRPALYGAPWDLQGPVFEEPDADALATLNASSGVASTALLTGGRMIVDGQEVGTVAVEQIKGSIEPTMLSGRAVMNDGEIVLTPSLMDSHDLSVGDTVAVQSADAPTALAVVGVGVRISVGSYSSDDGAIVTPSDFERFGRLSNIEGDGGVEFAVRVAPGADITAVRSQMATITGGFERVIGESFRPARIQNIGRVRSVPQIIEVFAALLILLVVLHALATVVSRRRHDLSVLRALGMRAGQARHVLWWHGGILAALAVAIGVPLGLVGGRLLWHVVTSSVDAVYSPRSPWEVLAILAVGMVVVSVAIGAALSRKAVPHSIARYLRSE